jgi:hypothetical protein
MPQLWVEPELELDMQVQAPLPRQVIAAPLVVGLSFTCQEVCFLTLLGQHHCCVQLSLLLVAGTGGVQYGSTVNPELNRESVIATHAHKTLVLIAFLFRFCVIYTSWIRWLRWRWRWC